jgi:hypothetical protein
MNYAALSIDELAARCALDADARVYAGQHFGELVIQLEDELRVERDELWEEAVNQAADALLEHAIDRMTPHLDVPAGSPYWRIG